MNYSLSEGAIMGIYNGGQVAAPVLQVIDIKLLQSPTPQSGNVVERYRLVLSDGLNYQQGMLATQLNHLAKDGTIQLHSVIRLKEFMCNAVHGRKVVIVLGFDSMGPPSEFKIGNPRPVDPSMGSSTQNQEMSHTTNQPLAQQQVKTEQKLTPNPAPPVRNTVAPSHPQTTTHAHMHNPPAQHNRPFIGGNPSVPQNKPPTSQTVDESLVQPIASISTFNNKFTIKGRVTSMSDIRRYSNQKGEGKLLSIDLLDAEGGEIRMTMFNDMVDKFHQILQMDKVFIVSKGTVKMADRRYSQVKNDYEITLNSDSLIIPCDEDPTIERLRIDLCSLENLQHKQTDEIVDVVGVILKVGDVNTITGKTTGKQFSKRSLTIVDSSNTTAELTMWGATAENFAGAEKDTVIAKAVRIGEYQSAKNLSTSNTSQVIVNADHPAVQSLRSWYESEGQYMARSNPPTSSASAGSGAPRGMGNDERKVLSQIKQEELGRREKPDFFMTRGYVMFIKQDGPMYYPACPTDGCNKKVTESAGRYYCEKCGREYEQPEHKYILSMVICDHTSSQWVSVYNDVGIEIMGQTADHVAQLKTSNDDKGLSDMIKSASYRPFMFRLMAKSEMYQDEPRVKCQVRQVLRINYASEARSMLDEIRRLRG